MTWKHLFSFGIENPKHRLGVWCGACAASSVLALLFWPFGAVPFLLLFGRSVWVAKKVL